MTNRNDLSFPSFSAVSLLPTEPSIVNLSHGLHPYAARENHSLTPSLPEPPLLCHSVQLAALEFGGDFQDT